MNEQSNKLNNVKKSITRAKTILSALEKIIAVIMIICAIAAVLIGFNSTAVNAAITKSVQQGYGVFTVDVSQRLVGGMIQADMDLQQLADQGEYATVIVIVMCISLAMLFIVRIIIRKLTISVKKIDQSESPFSRDLLASFKQVFILVSILVGIFSEVSVLITIIMVFVCIYKIIEYGVTLQEEIDETL